MSFAVTIYIVALKQVKMSSLYLVAQIVFYWLDQKQQIIENAQSITVLYNITITP